MPISIYPPTLQSTQPAFLASTNVYQIYFTLQSITAFSDIGHIQVRVVRQSNNRSIVNTSQYPDGTIYFVGGLNGDGKFDPVWDNRTSMPNTASCAKGTWGAITFTGAELKAAAEKKSGDGTGWMYLQFNMNVNSVVYIYSVELYPA